MAASFNKLDKSAPEKPGVLLAMVSMSTSPSNLLFFACTFKISILPFKSGLSTATCLSKRPGRNDNDASVPFETIHFRQQLVQRLLSFVITATNADEHFNKLGTGDGKEWNTGFTGDRFGEQSLTGTRRTDQQNALRDLRADGCESFRFLQKLDYLHEILLGFVDTGNVIERDARVRLHLKLGFGFTKRHRVVAAHASPHARSAAAAGSSGEQKQTANEQQRKRQVTQQVQEDATGIFGLAVRRKVDILFSEFLHKLAGGAWQLHSDSLHSVAQFQRN